MNFGFWLGLIISLFVVYRYNKIKKNRLNEKNTKNKTNKSISKSTFDDDPPLYNDPRFYRPDGVPYVNYKLFGSPSILVNDNNFHDDDDNW